MRRKGATIYAIFLMVLMVAGFVACFVFACFTGIKEAVFSICGMFVGFVIAQTYHELGHVGFASAVKMELVYIKFFCLKFYRKKGKLRMGLVSPFAPDETQVVPKKSGNMQKRALLYTAGGLIMGGILLVLLLAVNTTLLCLKVPSHFLLGLLPYCAYSFLLNVFPFEYASGKTDALVYRGIKKVYDPEKVMLSAMEIHGKLYEGYSFSEIEEKYYYDVPQLCEDEPLFSVLLDLRYRYHLEKGELRKSAECLNRLVQSREYLSVAETEKIAVELVYMHAIGGDIERAEESAKLCQDALKQEDISAKRALLAYSVAVGKTDAIKPLTEQATKCLQTERIKGLKKFEEILLERMQEFHSVSKE